MGRWAEAAGPLIFLCAVAYLPEGGEHVRLRGTGAVAGSGSFGGRATDQGTARLPGRWAGRAGRQADGGKRRMGGGGRALPGTGPVGAGASRRHGVMGTPPPLVVLSSGPPPFLGVSPPLLQGCIKPVFSRRLWLGWWLFPGGCAVVREVASRSLSRAASSCGACGACACARRSVCGATTAVHVLRRRPRTCPRRSRRQPSPADARRRLRCRTKPSITFFTSTVG